MGTDEVIFWVLAIGSGILFYGGWAILAWKCRASGNELPPRSAGNRQGERSIVTSGMQNDMGGGQ